MDKLYPLYRIMPALLLIYGVVMTFFGMLELRITGNQAWLAGDTSYEVRMLSYIGAARAFDPLFFFGGLAAIVAALEHRLKDDK